MSKPDTPTCPSCGVPFTEYGVLTLVCREREELREKLAVAETRIKLLSSKRANRKRKGTP